ncbi:hypothetical protein G7Y79_00005g016240 [Physcia stellaris]|nr:hypothetical protein G7Y79_00005g016240 [Physcia stellaris]
MKNRSKPTKKSSSKRRRSSHLSDDAESSSPHPQERSASIGNPEPDKGATVTPSEEAPPKRKGKQPYKKPTSAPSKEAQSKSNPEQADVTPPRQNHSRFGRPVKDANYDMHFHHGLDTSPKAVAKHEARIQRSRASSATRSVKAPSRKKKGDLDVPSASTEPVNTPTAKVNRGRAKQVSREPHSALVEGVDLSPRAEDAIDSELVVSDADSGSGSNSTSGSDVEGVERPGSPKAATNSESGASDADSGSVLDQSNGSDVEEVVERPVSQNQLISWISIIMRALLGGFWRLLGLIWGLLKWLLFC